MTKNYLYEYILTLYLANKNRPDPITGDPTKPVILMGGGSRCFDKDTLIKTNNGEKKISELEKGDYVLSYNHESDMRQFKRVANVFKNENNKKKCYKIKFKNSEDIKCTYDHKIFYDGNYVTAEVLKDIFDKNRYDNHYDDGINLYDVSSIEEIELSETYDLTVEGNSNYYLAANGGTLVHNSGKTVSVAQILLTFMENYADPKAKNRKNLYIIVYRNTSVDSRKTFKDFIEEFDRIGLEPMEQKRNPKNGKYEMVGDYEKVESPKPLIRYKGHIVEFMGMPEGDQEAVGCDIAFINEILENKNEHAFYSIVRRTVLLTMADWNPKQSVHYIYNIKRFNFHYPVTTYLDNKWLPTGQKADAEAQCPWELNESTFYVEISDKYGVLHKYNVPEGFTLEKWYKGYYQSEEAKANKEYFDGFLRRKWLKEERPENCREEDYHLYRTPNKLNYENGTVNRAEWLTYGEGVPSGQDGAIFANVKWVQEFPQEVDNQYFGLDYGFSCFDGDTSIITVNGNKKIKDVNVGDYVLTSNGYKKVLKFNDNGIKKVLEIKFDFDFGYRKIICTFDHKFKTTQGWKQLKDLTSKDVLFMSAFTKEKNMYVDRTQNTRTIFTPQGLKRYFTERFGKILMVKYQKTSIYTTVMAIRLIIKLRTLFLLLALNIQEYITILKTSRLGLEAAKIVIQKRIGSQGERKYSKNSIRRLENAHGVVRNIPLQIRTKDFVLGNVIINGSIKALKIMKHISVLFADNLSKGINILNKGLVQNHAHIHSLAEIEQITVLSEKTTNVYDLTVEDTHEYFANGILVHNCDPSALVSVGNIGMDLYIKKMCYQKTPTSDLLFDLVEKPLLQEEKRRYIEANSEQWYNRLVELRKSRIEAYSKVYGTIDLKDAAIEMANERLNEHIDSGLPIEPIYIVTDTADMYKGRGGAEEQQFTYDLNVKAQQYGYNWTFMKVKGKAIVPGIALMKKFNLHLISDKDFEVEQQNYCYIKDANGNLTNIPDKDSKFNHIFDAARYCIWTFFRFIFPS